MVKSIALNTGGIEIDETFSQEWAQISSAVTEHPLWTDPFADTLKNYEQNPTQAYALVLNWTKQMYHGSLAFPRYVGNLVGRAENHSAGRMLAINAAVERGYPDEHRSHFLLAVDLLRAMGLSDDEIVNIPKSLYSTQYIENHLDYTRSKSLAKAVGCLGIGIEALTTHEFTMLGNAYLRTAHGSVEKIYQSQGYFTENILADAQHTCEFERIAYLLWKSGETPEDLKELIGELREGALFSLDQRRLFFTGIYEETVKELLT